MDTTEHRPDQEAERLVEAWLRLWNGDYAGVEALVSPGFRLHAAMTDGGDGSAVDSPVGGLLLTQLQAIA